MPKPPVEPPAKRSDPVTDEKVPPAAIRVLIISSVAFTLMFAVWLMFGILAIPIQKEFGLSEIQFAWLVSVATLNGAIWRLLFGILTDRWGGRLVLTLLLLATSAAAFWVAQCQTFPQLLFGAFLVGIAGNAFSVGIAWNSAWFPKGHQGFALGVFGAGNVGASVTKFIGPTLIAAIPAGVYFGGYVQGGWRFIPQLYGALLLVVTLLVWVMVPGKDRRPGSSRALGDMLKPLGVMRVWRFSLYYVVVFGAYVALSVWLPKYYTVVYKMPLASAALLTALFIFPASLLRPLGGWMADKYGARRIMYWVFGGMSICLFALSLPFGHIVFYVPTQYSASGTHEAMRFSVGLIPFTVLVFLVGCGMGIGKAAVFKYIPEYFPKDVGAVGGLVGLLGALGGFFLPPLFAAVGQFTKLPQTTFAVLFLVTIASFLWLHLTVWRMLNHRSPDLKHRFDSHDHAQPGQEVSGAAK